MLGAICAPPRQLSRWTRHSIAASESSLCISSLLVGRPGRPEAAPGAPPPNHLSPSCTFAKASQPARRWSRRCTASPTLRQVRPRPAEHTGEPSGVQFAPAGFSSARSPAAGGGYRVLAMLQRHMGHAPASAATGRASPVVLRRRYPLGAFPALMPAAHRPQPQLQPLRAAGLVAQDLPACCGMVGCRSRYCCMPFDLQPPAALLAHPSPFLLQIRFPPPAAAIPMEGPGMPAPEAPEPTIDAPVPPPQLVDLASQGALPGEAGAAPGSPTSQPPQPRRLLINAC